MQYIQYIEESQTWTCPKTGKWKIICVGGGASGSVDVQYRVLYTNNVKISEYMPLCSSGNASSFGDIISSLGGKSVPYDNVVRTLLSDRWLGQSGFTGQIEINKDTNTYVVNSLEASGYGAGGSSLTSKSTQTPTQYYIGVSVDNTNIDASISGSGAAYIGGYSGEVKMTLIDINENENIAVTVGKGGNVLSDIDNLITQSIKRISDWYVTPIDFTKFTNTYNIFKSQLSDICRDGKDGVVILQYMGE